MAQRAQRGYPTRFCNLDEARARFGDRVDRLGAYLERSDEPADAAIVTVTPGPAGEAVVGAALDGGADVPAPLRALVEEARRVPPWVDWERVERGGRFFFRAGLLGGLVLGGRALIFGYASPAGNKPLVFSGRLREAAGPRLHETSRFVQAIMRRGELRPGGAGWRITLRVRLMHAQVRRMISASGRWDGAAWGLPINQHDLVATSLLFSVVTLGGLRALGLDVSRDEADDFMHLWRWTAHVMGVDPALVPTTEPEGYRLGELIAATQAPPDDDSRALTAALIEHGLVHPDPKARDRARRQLGLARAIVRHLLGAPLADRLGVPATRERFVLPAAIAAIRGVEQARRRSRGLEALLVARGERYWDEVVRGGLSLAATDFSIPARLGRAFG